MSRLLGYYPQFTEQYIIWELPMVKGWAYLAAGIERDGWLAFNGVKKQGKGYIAKEIEHLMSQVK